MKRLLLILLLMLSAPAAWALGETEGELLEPEKAFSAEAIPVDADTVRIEWTVADGYYMYRSKFRFTTETEGVTLGEPAIPPGKVKQDEFFGKVEIYRNKVAVDIPVERSADAPAAVVINATSQGCADIGVCYPPLNQAFAVNLPEAATTAGAADALKQISSFGASLGLGAQEEEFLPPDEAFRFSAEVGDANTLVASWSIADGYYLYREKFGFALIDAEGVTLGEAALPDGKVKDDEFIGRTEVYYHNLDVRLPLVRTNTDATEVNLQVKYQGCAEAGLCYPPATKTVSLALPVADAAAAEVGVQPVPAAEAATGVSQKSFFWAVLGAFGVGLLLTFTPCVLPMIPILSSIIVGAGGEQITKARGGLLSFSYVMGTAVTYTAAGVLAGYTGDQLQAYFQNVWAIGILATILVLLSLSMFGFYEIQMPSFIQSRLQERSQKIQGGTFVGVFIMGLISALIVGACVSPLLITVLGAAIVTKDPVLGGSLMFAMAMGMGVILIAIGVGAGFLLPRAGVWMDRVKYVFGVLLIAVAIYLLGILPQVPVLYLWAALFVVTGVYLGALEGVPEGASGWRYLWKGLGIFLIIWGVLALIGGMAGNRDFMRPVNLASAPAVMMGTGGTTATADAHAVFEQITTLEQLETRMAEAAAAGKPVMVDFFATWCTDCLRMEKGTFSDPRVQKIMSDRFVALQVDVTDPQDQEGKDIKKKFGVFGPPALLFFGSGGEHMKQLDFYGYKPADEFIGVLNQVK